MSVSAFNKRLRKMHRERLDLLSEWYGRDFASTEVAAHISSPVLLGQGIKRLMSALEAPEKRVLRILREKWPETVGESIAKLTEPLEWKDGVLTLEVRHSALLRELRPSLELLKNAVNSHLSGLECSDVKLTIAGGGRKYPTGRG